MDKWIKEKRGFLFAGITVALFAAVCMFFVILMPKVNAEQSPIDSAQSIAPGNTTVEPGNYYKITGANTDTYTLTYTGKESDEPAYIVLDNASFSMTADKPAIKFTAQEASDERSSFCANFVVYIKGENTVTSTAVGAKSPLLQVENMTYEVKSYDKDSPYVADDKKFKNYSVECLSNVRFTGTGSGRDILRLATANGSYGAAIGSAEIGSMGENIRFKAGQGQYYIVIDGVRYKHGQEVFTGNLKCGGGNITFSDNANVVVEGNGFGAGIGCGASETDIITFKGDGNLNTTNIQRARATQVMSGDNVKIEGGAVAVKMSTSSAGNCIGTGAVAGKPQDAGQVVITGGALDLDAGGAGAEYASAVNGQGMPVYKYILDLQSILNRDGTFMNGESYELIDTIGGEAIYYAQYAGAASDADSLLEFNVDVDNVGNYRFRGNASSYFSYLGKKELNFYLPTQILEAHNLTVSGDFDKVTYQYRVGNGNFTDLEAGYAVKAKETKITTIKLTGIPQFCTSVTYSTSTGQTGSITEDGNGEYLFSFEMPKNDYSIAFSYEIGRYQIQYHLGDDADEVSNPNPDNYVCGETLTLQEPTWEGRTFVGWYNENDEQIADVSSEVVNGTVNVYAKWACTVSFVDDEGTVLYETVVDYGTRFMKSDYPSDPVDSTVKSFIGWIVNGQTYPKGSHPEFTVSENTTIQGEYEAIGYYVYINGIYTNVDGLSAVADLKRMSNFSFYFQNVPMEFTDTPSENGMYYRTIEFAERSDVTTGKVTAKNGYQIASIEARDAQGNLIELLDDMDDDFAFSFTMPDQNVYLTVNFQTPDFTISYYDYDLETGLPVEITPIEEAGNPTPYSFNANSPELYLNPAPQTDKYRRFAGWYVFGDPDQSIVETIPTGAYSKDLILLATWEDVVTYPINVDESVADYIKVYDENGTQVDKGIPGEELSIVVTPGLGVKYESMTFTYTDEDGGVYTNRKTPTENQAYPCTYKTHMPEYMVDIVGEFSLIEYRITYLGLNGAENENPDSYNIKSVIDLKDPVRPGYTFDEWTIVLPDPINGYDSVREEKIETISDMIGNLIIVAKWKEDGSESVEHTINIDQNITNGTVTSYMDKASKEQYVFLNVNPERGYRLVGISYRNTADVENGEEPVVYSAVRALQAAEDLLDVSFDIPLVQVAEGIYYFIMPDNDITLSAEFELIEYQISYQEGENSANPLVYTVKSDISLADAVKSGYEFLGWYNDAGEKVTEIKDSIGDLTLTAKWKEIVNTPPDDNQEGDTNKDPSSPPSTDGAFNVVVDKEDLSRFDSVLTQLQKLINDKSKVDSSEDVSKNATDRGQQIGTGDTANISHLLLLCILSLIVIIIACPKKKDTENK